MCYDGMESRVQTPHDAQDFFESRRRVPAFVLLVACSCVMEHGHVQDLVTATRISHEEGGLRYRCIKTRLFIFEYRANERVVEEDIHRHQTAEDRFACLEKRVIAARHQFYESALYNVFSAAEY